MNYYKFKLVQHWKARRRGDASQRCIKNVVENVTDFSRNKYCGSNFDVRKLQFRCDKYITKIP